MTIHHDFPLSNVLWYKVGGKAKHFIQTEDKEDVLQALDFVEKHPSPRLFICGLGSNLIFSDEYFDGTVIQISSVNKNPFILKEKEMIEVFSGASLDELISFSFENNLTGLEWAGGLPGTVGAGIRGNVGAFGGEIKDNVLSAEVLELYGNVFDTHLLSGEELNFSYRNSVIKEKKNYIVLSAQFKLTPGNTESVLSSREIYNKNIIYRKTHHPLEYPTCGSVFKNIVDKKQVENVLSVWPDIQEAVDTRWYGKVSMGYIIKRLGFSEFRVGNMQVSPKHSNFITNLGNAKASDATAIITSIQEKVSEMFGFSPEIEVEIVR